MTSRPRSYLAFIGVSYVLTVGHFFVGGWGRTLLYEGGQLFFMSNVGIDHAISRDSTLDFNVTNGAANAPFAMVFAALNAGNAPNGWFYGVDVTFGELYAVSGPLLGMLDADGNNAFSVPAGAIPAGFEVDVVTLELNAIGAPIEASTAVTHRF